MFLRPRKIWTAKLHLKQAANLFCEFLLSFFLSKWNLILSFRARVRILIDTQTRSSFRNGNRRKKKWNKIVRKFSFFRWQIEIWTCVSEGRTEKKIYFKVRSALIYLFFFFCFRTFELFSFLIIFNKNDIFRKVFFTTHVCLSLQQ